MKYLFFIIMSLCACHVVHASSTQPDSTVFRQYAMTHILPMPDFYAMQSVFRYWQLQDKSEDDNAQKNIMFWWPDNLYTSPGYAITGGAPRNFYHPKEEPAYNESREFLRQQFKYRMKDADSIQNEKAQLVQSLTAMDTLLHNKPLLFQVIYKKYGGNIQRYVDDLYAKSFMTSPRRFKRMMRRMRPKLLVKDLGVNYTLSMALYEVWLMQQNNPDSIKE